MTLIQIFHKPETFNEITEYQNQNRNRKQHNVPVP